MKNRKATLVDLHYDILKEIVIRVARSSDGAKHFANAISVCKAFQQFVEDVDVLRAVNFDNILVSGRWELFQLRGGLTCRCARSGETKAQSILAKIIIVSISHLLEEKTAAIDMEHESSSKDGNLSEKASDFLENFMPDKTCPNFIGYHYDFVKIFLSRATHHEFIEMTPYINNYIGYFVASSVDQEENLHTTMQLLVDSRILDQNNRKTLESYCINKEVTSRLLELCYSTRKRC